MIDKAKRNIIKALTVAAGAGVTLAAGSGHTASGFILSGSSAALGGDNPLADITVSSRISSVTNDIEVVIKNTGASSATITQMTPSYTVTHRGQFDFSKLLDGGELNLTPGQSVSVPLEQRRAVGQSAPLMESLRKSMSIVTEGQSFAKVNIVDTAMLA